MPSIPRQDLEPNSGPGSVGVYEMSSRQTSSHEPGQGADASGVVCLRLDAWPPLARGAWSRNANKLTAELAVGIPAVGLLLDPKSRAQLRDQLRSAGLP